MQSHPVWVRGLKLYLSLLFVRLKPVAPCMGAWIETKIMNKKQTSILVAPCMGAWIETKLCCSYLQANRSHPVWVRGLKPH